MKRVRRDLDLLTAPFSPDYNLDATTLSSHMSGSLPPGLRFPTGTIIGHHLIILGTYLSSSINNFSIWSLDLGSKGGEEVVESLRKGERLEWCRVDPGSVLMRGSWNRAVEWRGSVVVLGDRERDIGIDYNHRQVSHYIPLECDIELILCVILVDQFRTCRNSRSRSLRNLSTSDSTFTSFRTISRSFTPESIVYSRFRTSMFGWSATRMLEKSFGREMGLVQGEYDRVQFEIWDFCRFRNFTFGDTTPVTFPPGAFCSRIFLPPIPLHSNTLYTSSTRPPESYFSPHFFKDLRREGFESSGRSRFTSELEGGKFDGGCCL